MLGYKQRSQRRQTRPTYPRSGQHHRRRTARHHAHPLGQPIFLGQRPQCRVARQTRFNSPLQARRHFPRHPSRQSRNHPQRHRTRRLHQLRHPPPFPHRPRRKPIRTPAKLTRLPPHACHSERAYSRVFLGRESRRGISLRPCLTTRHSSLFVASLYRAPRIPGL